MMVEATMVGADTIGHPSSTVVGGKDKQEQAAWVWNYDRGLEVFMCCRWEWLGEVVPRGNANIWGYGVV
jgi:hypothetical protein